MALLPFRIWACSLVLVASFAALGGCQANAPSKAVVSIELPDTVSVDDRIAEILSQHKINTAGFAVIQNERVVWQKVFEDQSTGVPASDETLFNIASITKTVIAETVLRLAAAGRITLDGPMSDHWLDPDLVDDLRHMQLTPRHVLTHRTGFPNWRFFTDSGKLQFVSDPGQGFGYSGEGFNYLAKFVESKLDTPFEDLARQNVLDPAGVSEAALSVNPKLFLRLAEALDADDNFPGHYCRPDGWCREAGSFSAAGGMAITVGDYAQILIQSMRGQAISDATVAARNTLVTETYEIDCTVVPEALCPDRIGYGLGWHVTELDQDKTIGHLGSDWSSVTMAYYYESSHDGLVVFINAPNAAGIAAMVDILELFDPDSPELHGYTARRDRSR